jgi:hypothetical protein
LKLKPFLRAIFSVDPRWSRRGRDAVWFDPATRLEMVYCPRRDPRIISPTGQTLRMTRLVMALLPERGAAVESARRLVSWIETPDNSGARYVRSNPGRL